MKVVLMIDGGHLRVGAAKAGKTYDPAFIEAFAHKCIDPSESLQRILYYDCPQYRGQHPLPVSGVMKNFTASDRWLDDLASKDLFAVRRGTLAFRGWVPKNIPISSRPLTDADFSPNFEQKGVDMRIGLDIATISAGGRIERIILVSGDTDLIPAMKHARKTSLQVALVQMPSPMSSPSTRLLAHADHRRVVAWP